MERPSLKEILEGAPVWTSSVGFDSDDEADADDTEEIERLKKEAEEDNKRHMEEAAAEAQAESRSAPKGSDASASMAATPGKRSFCQSVGNLFSYGRVDDSEPASPSGPVGEEFVERAKYIPLRLSYDERKQLHLLEASLSVSGYTDKLDTPTFCNKSKRIRTQLQDIAAFLTGLVVAVDYATGQDVLHDKSFSQDAAFFQSIFELARRYKIMNPDKLRGDYGKVMYLLQDANSEQIQELLDFSPVVSVRTVFHVLEETGAVDMLRDPHIEIATRVITPEGKTRPQINREIQAKNKAIRFLAQTYQRHRLSKDTIEQCLYSISDNNCLLYFDRDPIDRMIELLQEHFSADKVDERYSLAIEEGTAGARLTHSHVRQYHYVLQSMSLWRAIISDFFKLWYLADEDLLDSANPYSLKDTGQGLQRKQNSPRIYKAMTEILTRTQQKMGHWVGSSVIHIGDANVPNALIFIDKYTQVARILGPIGKVLDSIDRLSAERRSAGFIAAFGGANRLKKDILHSFFREGFDGSGGDNFFEAGSCIDGRLTSAWNWCQTLDRKPFFPVFRMAGFASFDGKL